MSALEAHVRMVLDAVWSKSNGSWDNLLAIIKSESLEIDGEYNNNWMRTAVKLANDLSEAKIKDIIKLYGTQASLPKKKKSGGGEGKEEEKVTKNTYITSLLEVLKAKHGNDFQKVTEFLQDEIGKSSKKGFSSSSSSSPTSISTGGGKGGGFSRK
jgi:hypothetical protein